MASSILYLAAFLAVLAAVVAEEMYSDQFDHINTDEILANDELRDEYYHCFMETGPCRTDDMKYFQEKAAEAFITRCSKCTEVQKQNAAKITEWYTINRPEEWKAMMEKMIADAKKLNISPV